MGRSEETDAQRWLGDLSWITRQKVGIVSGGSPASDIVILDSLRS